MDRDITRFISPVNGKLISEINLIYFSIGYSDIFPCFNKINQYPPPR